MYNCILFDMDGTLVNSYEGIYHAYRVTMEKLGRPFGGEAFVRRAIGAPLPWVWKRPGPPRGIPFWWGTVPLTPTERRRPEQPFWR